ncbi:MAG: hypothetical protein OXG36_14590 [Caldilineaceae bacterium]|nr:hypothetical protein [Caldilineaceae bacterium]
MIHRNDGTGIPRGQNLAETAAQRGGSDGRHVVVVGWQEATEIHTAKDATGNRGNADTAVFIYRIIDFCDYSLSIEGLEVHMKVRTGAGGASVAGNAQHLPLAHFIPWTQILEDLGMSTRIRIIFRVCLFSNIVFFS